MINKNQQVVKLSPENYIRQKVRSLPIHECLVNKGWNESKMCTVIVSRRHVNGNVTVGSYLVDLMCLGVKDTSYAFNIPMFEYSDKFVVPLGDYGMGLEKIGYTLAHNIIYAGIDFATDIGFLPHSDFLKTTRFLLDEDDDNVELIEVECGYNGQPALIMGDENRKECMKIIAQLDHLVGKGNYKVFDTNGFTGNEPEEDPEEYTPEQFEADKKFFKKKVRNFKNQSPKEFQETLEVTRRLFYQLIDDSKVDKAYDEITEALDVTVSYHEIPDEFLGIRPDTIKDIGWVRSAMFNAFKDSESSEESIKLCSELKNVCPDIPAVGVLDLFLSSDIAIETYIDLLDHYRMKFPEYKLFEIIKHYTIVSMDKPFDVELVSKEMKISNFFGERKSLYWVEMYHFIKLYSLHTLAQADPIRIGALYDFLNEDYLPEEATVAGKFTSLIFMVDFVSEKLSSNDRGLFNKLTSFIQ